MPTNAIALMARELPIIHVSVCKVIGRAVLPVPQLYPKILLEELNLQPPVLATVNAGQLIAHIDRASEPPEIFVARLKAHFLD